MNLSVDRQFSARGFSPQGAWREEVLKIQPEKERVGEKCEGFMPEGHVWMFLSGGTVLREGVEASPYHQDRSGD